jgi:hypothetical protein
MTDKERRCFYCGCGGPNHPWAAHPELLVADAISYTHEGPDGPYYYTHHIDAHLRCVQAAEIHIEEHLVDKIRSSAKAEAERVASKCVKAAVAAIIAAALRNDEAKP